MSSLCAGWGGDIGHGRSEAVGLQAKERGFPRADPGPIFVFCFRPSSALASRMMGGCSQYEGTVLAPGHSSCSPILKNPSTISGGEHGLFSLPNEIDICNTY